MIKITNYQDPFKTKEILEIDGKKITIYNINKLQDLKLGDISRFPKSIKVLLENVLRNCTGANRTSISFYYIENLLKHVEKLL